MKDLDKEEFAKRIVAIYGFYNREADAMTLRIWFDSLKPYQLPEISDALTRYVSNTVNGQFLPKPSDIIRMISGSSQSEALQAWSKFDRAVREVGPYKTVCFDDPLMHSVISDMGGWISFSTITDEEWPFKRNEFEKRYQGYKNQNGKREYPKALVGIFEATNSLNGYLGRDDVCLLGNPDKAKLTYQGGSDQRKQILTLSHKDLAMDQQFFEETSKALRGVIESGPDDVKRIEGAA